MTTTVEDMDTKVPIHSIHRLLGHMDNVQITTVKDGDIHRDILGIDIMFQLGKRGKQLMQPNTQLSTSILHLLAILLVNFSTECTPWATHHFGEGTINLRVNSISGRGHRHLVIQLKLVVEMNL